MQKTRKGFGVVELFVAGTIIVLLIVFYGIVSSRGRNQTPAEVQSLLSETERKQ